MPNQIPGLEDHYRRLKKAKVLMEDKEYLLNHPNCNWKSYYGGVNFIVKFTKKICFIKI